VQAAPGFAKRLGAERFNRFCDVFGQNQGLPARAIVPSVRELADRYSLSIKVVRQTLQDLIDEGVLYTISRVGTFVGNRPNSDAGYICSCCPISRPSEMKRIVRMGFPREKISHTEPRWVLESILNMAGQA